MYVIPMIAIEVHGIRGEDGFVVEEKGGIIIFWGDGFFWGVVDFIEIRVIDLQKEEDS